MNRFNLSEWAVRNKILVLYFMIGAAMAGAWAYGSLGREEDPPFTVKTMVIKTLWQGATTGDTLRQVTDRIEKKLDELPFLDYVKSYTKPGESVVFVNLKDTVLPRTVPDLWYQVRKKVRDIAYAFPSGIAGPYFNDEFGDTYSLIYALTADGFTHRELRDQAERLRTEMLSIPDVAKVDLIGTQDEKIYLEFSTRQLAALGLDTDSLIQTLQAQNSVAPSGSLDSGPEHITIRVSGSFTSEESLKSVNFRANGRFVRLTDIATVKRGYADPPQPMFRFNGEPAIGLAISMTVGGDVLALGRHVKDRAAELEATLPVGIDLQLVADQPKVVKEAVGEFTKSLMEAIAIVLAVSFLALGWRPGIVVAVAIPLVLAITFVAMQLTGISLQRISLGALIIALGLLVDDAMIAVEMMIRKMEEGYDRIKAATFAYTSTAFPMLAGTLVTIAGFVPVGFARSKAGEYCFSLFAVVAIALLVSWLVAVVFTPLTGVIMLPGTLHRQGSRHGASAFARWFHRTLDLSLRHSRLVLVATAVIFVLALVGLCFVPQQFFPKSDRPELLVDLTLPQSASLEATETVAERVEALLKADTDVERWSFYVGQGAIRFYLPLDTQLANNNFAQAVVVTKGYSVRDRVAARLEKALESDFDALIRVTPLELGPPVGWPLKFRVSGPDPSKTREFAHAFAQVLGQNTNTRMINYDWNEQAKVVKVEVDQERARILGLTSQQLANNINAILSGTRVTQLRDATYLIDIVARAVPNERARLDTLREMMLPVSGGKSVPLGQVATLSYELEPPMIWRRHRVPTVTVQADVAPGVEPTTVVAELEPVIAGFRAKLPAGYSVVVGGVTEESAKAQTSIFVVFPLMLVLMVTILMVQLKSFSRLILVLLTAPLGLIGVVGALLLAEAPLGFVAILGVISLAGIVIRNSVILIAQIDQQILAGEPAWSAVISATQHRLRPILLTATAAILGMIPIAPTVFWGPMAYAVMGGLVVATLLTLVVLPALYVTWFRIKPIGIKPPSDALRTLAAATA